MWNAHNFILVKNKFKLKNNQIYFKEKNLDKRNIMSWNPSLYRYLLPTVLYGKARRPIRIR